MPFNTSSSDKHQTVLDQFQYQVRRFLGCGGGGFVYLASDIRKKKKRVAVKVVQQSNPLGEGEWRHWLRLRHTNLIQLYEKFEVAGDRYYIMEYASNGTLFEWLKRNKAKSGLPAISEQRSRRWVRQLLDAVRYLHAQGLYHFDIKSSNILLDANLNVKLSDFGTMKSLQDDNFRHNGCRFYRPPEILAEQTKLRSARSLEGVDMWALGATLLRVFSGGKLISYRDFNQCNSENKSELLKNIRENLERVISVPLAVEGVRDLVLQLLHPDPRKRPSCVAALRHPWLTPVSPAFSTGGGRGSVRQRTCLQRSLSSGCNVIHEKNLRKPSPRVREHVDTPVARSPDVRHLSPRHYIREKERHRRPKTSALHFPSPETMLHQPTIKAFHETRQEDAQPLPKSSRKAISHSNNLGAKAIIPKETEDRIPKKKKSFVPLIEYKLSDSTKALESPAKTPEIRRFQRTPSKIPVSSPRKDTPRRPTPSSNVRLSVSPRGLSRSQLVSRMAVSAHSITPKISSPKSDRLRSPMAESSFEKLEKAAEQTSSLELDLEKRTIKVTNRLLQMS